MARYFNSPRICADIRTNPGALLLPLCHAAIFRRQVVSAVISAFTLLKTGNPLPQFSIFPQKLRLVPVKLPIFRIQIAAFFFQHIKARFELLNSCRFVLTAGKHGLRRASVSSGNQPFERTSR